MINREFVWLIFILLNNKVNFFAWENLMLMFYQSVLCKLVTHVKNEISSKWLKKLGKKKHIIFRLQDQANKLNTKLRKQQKFYKDENQMLTEEYHRIARQYKDLHRKMRFLFVVFILIFCS